MVKNPHPTYWVGLSHLTWVWADPSSGLVDRVAIPPATRITIRAATFPIWSVTAPPPSPAGGTSTDRQLSRRACVCSPPLFWWHSLGQSLSAYPLTLVFLSCPYSYHPSEGRNILKGFILSNLQKFERFDEKWLFCREAHSPPNE